MHIYNKIVLALGSNLGDKKQHLQNAINLINNTLGLVTQVSAIYETPSWGFNSYPFYNMCIVIHSHLSAQDLLIALKEIEKNLGRTTKTVLTYEARTVDIDIIYYNDAVINEPHLHIPHREMQNRKFVLVPLNDLQLDWQHPILHKNTADLLTSCTDDSQIKKVDAIELPKNGLNFQHLNFLVIEGNIGSGKTTLSKKIAEDFNGKTILERFNDNPFLPKFYKDEERFAFPLEMSFLADRYSQLNQHLDSFDLFKDLIVADYFIYKSLIFAQVTLQNDEMLLYRSIFDVMYKEIKKPDIYVFLYQNTENLLKNIKKRGRSFEENIKATYLDQITQSYSNFIKTLPKENILIIDVTNKNFVDNHADYLFILEQINNKILAVANR
ncbi:2-amino-4-hydroxy-6-hydroxymethyldihydropteridine diphosphokinase [Myroides sp. JBRI-B21084]|uniref:2-amino-4-hydroxy-6- hydroxymethyldihydropteridine diphosphokinase n=1 Tax=Myroides sp. JBRI-B21084 TaxID=3119977 RepID=UPI0026E47900|nr:2-amino-4-hydroxy-6-hydroxymethyldihydropteridine diphosphokinase [Paenimyroides cloacae]WKW45386.1 2-amino-4-hydroxy-6-hydroxymethyldihydropteridine diphosphokinase [Paenimyroides cloacae]